MRQDSSVSAHACSMIIYEADSETVRIFEHVSRTCQATILLALALDACGRRSFQSEGFRIQGLGA